MAHDRSRRGSQSITQQQKQTLIAVYRRTGNMSQAMREANIRSPRTAYLWWHRYTEEGEAGLQPRSHARHAQERLPEDVAEQIRELRRQEPSWGRRQIAGALAQRHGRQIASPSSVEVVLRLAGLWEPGAQQEASTPRSGGPPDWLRGGVDYERLIATIQEGIRLSVQSDARGASQVLYQQVWRPLEADHALEHRLLTARESGLGSWLLGSRLHLGHSLMNSGLWPQASHHLLEAIDWMNEHDIEPRQRAWEEAPRIVSLRRDDVLLGCFQHMAIVLGKERLNTALRYLGTASYRVHNAYHPLAPSDKSMLGSLDCDLAYLKLRSRRMPEEEIRRHLQRAQQLAEDAGSLANQAFAQIAWARLYDRLACEAGVREQATYRQRRDQMEHAVQQALDLMEREQGDRPMRLTMTYVDAAQLAYAHGMPIDRQWIRRAAEYCVQYGYRGQARHMLAIPSIQTWLSDEAWRSLTALSRSM